MPRCLTLLLCLSLLPAGGFSLASSAAKRKQPAHTKAKTRSHVATAVKAPVKAVAKVVAPNRRTRKAALVAEAQPVVIGTKRWHDDTRRSSYAFDPTAGDNVDGDDLEVRRAAVDALGPYNGTVVVVNPQTGRVLTIVNQKTALDSGFTPCSTIKLVTAFAALKEGLIERDTLVKLTRYTSLDLSSAIAHSNNPYFKVLGDRLGYERVVRYASMFGIGEKAGWQIPGERPGSLPEAPPSYGGVGMMTAYGEGIELTPLELAALVSTIANGGTLYHLQYPKSQEDIEHFVPRVKRHLDIENWIADVKVGMRGAVDFGTAHRAGVDQTEPILGKTGTCHDSRALNHLGWFGSFNDVSHNQLVVVVLLTGGFRINGPVAAGVAGSIYKQLSQRNFSASSQLYSTQICCTR